MSEAPRAIRTDPPGTISRSDILAGVSVALILVPQSMAYAELAGMPPHYGLYAAGFPLIAAAFLASSPYIQTGPVALTGLLTFGALLPLAPPGTVEYARIAALLSLVVGVARLVVGGFRLGWLVYLMSRSMMTGFLSGAAVLILSSQLPGALGVIVPPDAGVLQRAWFAVSDPSLWEAASVGLALFTIVAVIGAARIHPLVPGVLVAAAVGLAYSKITGYQGVTVGEIPGGLPPITADLPWELLPKLIVPGIVISVMGFAEGLSISRLFASMDRQRWDADREFLSKGVACIVAAFTSGLPVGGSLSRTSVNRLAGAKSRWSGLVTGVTVLLFLPFAPVLSALPRAILSGIVIAALSSLVRPRELMRLWRVSPPQAGVAWATFVATLWMAPRIDHAILFGVGLATLVHLWRELKPHVPSKRSGDTLFVDPSGVLWFGSAPALEDELFARIAEEPEVQRVVIRCAGLGRIDLSGAFTLKETMENARRAGLEMTLEDVPMHAISVLRAVGVPMATSPSPPEGGANGSSGSPQVPGPEESGPEGAE